MTILMMTAAALFQCAGTGYVEDNLPTTLEPTGKEWIDRINSGTVAFDAVITLEDGNPIKASIPEQIASAPGLVEMTIQTDDDTTIEAFTMVAQKKINIEYNRLSKMLVLSTVGGKWVGRCQKL